MAIRITHSDCGIIIELCREKGFHEYFDPYTGDGLGSILFSWSAALLLDVLMEDGT